MGNEHGKDSGTPAEHGWPTPNVEWPPKIGEDVVYTYKQLQAMALHPMLTGIGRVRRDLSDEDWVSRFAVYSAYNGRRQTLVDLLHLLTVTFSEWSGSPGPIGPYPASESDVTLPLADVDYVDSFAAHSGGVFTQSQVRGMLLNAAYAGVGTDRPIISPRRWVEAVESEMDERGVSQTLVNILYLLRQTFGQPGDPRGF